MARGAGQFLGEEQAAASLGRRPESISGEGAFCEVVRVGVGGQGVEVDGESLVGLFERLVDPATDQSPALHQWAANRVFEVLGFIAIGRPVQRVRPCQPEQWRCGSQSLGVLPRASVGIPVGVAAGTADPTAADHRLQCGVEQDLAAVQFGRQRVLGDRDRGQGAGGIGVVGDDIEVECVVDEEPEPVG